MKSRSRTLAVLIGSISICHGCLVSFARGSTHGMQGQDAHLIIPQRAYQGHGGIPDQTNPPNSHRQIESKGIGER